MHPLSLRNLSLLATLLNPITAEILWPFSDNASQLALKFQPVIDFDDSACYQTAAVTRGGHCNEGLERGDCRTLDRLYKANTYVRERCTPDGWCFFLYGYYSERDNKVGLSAGHLHDWEHIGIWTLNERAVYVAWSAHGDYSVNTAVSVPWEGTHAKFVIHRGGALTHSFRRAFFDEKPENALGKWFKASLVDVQRMDSTVQYNLLTHDFGSAHIDLTSGGFDAAYDETWKKAKALSEPKPRPPKPVRPPQ